MAEVTLLETMLIFSLDEYCLRGALVAAVTIPLILTPMTDNIQFLGVAARLFPYILSGEKTSTIRWQERLILPGPMKFVCDGNSDLIVKVDVFRCTEMPLTEAASFVGKADEWPDEIMLEGMREHYPEIQLSSLVQVIEYKPPA